MLGIIDSIVLGICIFIVGVVIGIVLGFDSGTAIQADQDIEYLNLNVDNLK